MTHHETLYVAAVTAYAVRESRDRLERKLVPPPVYIFFAHCDENGTPFGTLRAAVIACAGYQEIDHWIGHGVAFAALTHASAIAIVAHASITRAIDGGDPAEIPAEDVIPAMLSIVTWNDGEQLCMAHRLTETPEGGLEMADPVELPVNVLDRMMIPPLKPEVVIDEETARNCRQVVDALGLPVWIPIEAITVPVMGVA